MIRFRIEKSFCRDGWDIWLCDYGRKNRIAKPIELEFVEIDDGMLLPTPTLKLGHEDGQLFIDAMVKGLAESGLLKNKATDEIIKAKDDNLSDLRKLVDKLVK